jgi:hypothetical protein
MHIVDWTAKRISKRRLSNWQKRITGISFMRYCIYAENTKMRIVPKRQPLSVNSYMRKRLMKPENTTVFDKRIKILVACF